MKHRLASAISTLFVVCCLAAAPSSARAQSLDLTWHTIDSGGGVSTSPDNYWVLEGTIGQADGWSIATGPSLTLASGFWTPFRPPCRPDVNTDDSLDVSDIFRFLEHWFRGCAAVNLPLCQFSADYDESGQLQVADIFAFLHAWFAGCP